MTYPSNTTLLTTAAFTSPRTHHPFYLRQTAIVAALSDLQEQTAGVVNTLLPTLPQIRPPGICLPTLRLSFVLPRRFLQVLAHRLAIYVQLPCDLRNTPSVMM